MVRASPIGFLVIGCAAGCGSRDAELFLGFPQVDSARSIVLVVARNGEQELYASPLNGSRLRVKIEYDGEPIEALLFAQTLEELRLVEGALEHPGPGDDDGVLGALGPIRSYAARVDPEEGLVEWVDDPAVAAKEARYKKGPSTCRTFSTPTRAGSLSGSLAFAVPIDDEHALLGSRDGELVIASQAGLTTIEPPFTGYVRSAFSDGRHVYLSAWYSPAVYRGEPSATSGVTNVERLPDSPLANGASVLAGGNGTIIAGSEEGEAAWFDGTAWTTLPPINLNDTQMRAAWTETEAFYWPRGSASLNRVDQAGDVYAENLGTSGGAFSLATFEEIGTVIGTGDGTFLLRNAPGWEGLGGDYGWWALDLEGHDDGFFFLLASGTVGQYRRDPDDPFCPDQPVLGFINDGSILRLGSEKLLAAGWEGNDRTEVVIVEL